MPPPSRARAHPNHPQEGVLHGQPPHPRPTASWPPRPSSSTPTTGPTDAVAHLATEHPRSAPGPTTTPTWPTNWTTATGTTTTPGPPSGPASRPSTGSTPPSASPPTAPTRIGHRDVAQREAALALGVRVAVHDSRQNDRNPVIWQPGQDYRMADALHAARHQPTRTRHGPERVGPER